MITYQEYKQRVSKLTSAIAMWIYKNNPSDAEIAKVNTRAQKVIRKWFYDIIPSTSPYL